MIATILSFGAIAKGSSYAHDDGKPGQKSVNCMVDISNVNTTRFVNVSYVRSIDLSSKNDDSNGIKSVLNIRMASNYGATSHYAIDYFNEARAQEAFKSLVQKINNCN